MGPTAGVITALDEGRAIVVPAPAAGHDPGEKEIPPRRGRRRRPGLATIALVLLGVALLVTSFRPSREGPTLAQATRPTNVVLAWPSGPPAATYVLEILDGSTVLWKQIYDSPYAEEAIVLPTGRRLSWRAYLTNDRTTLTPASPALGQGSFTVER